MSAATTGNQLGGGIGSASSMSSMSKASSMGNASVSKMSSPTSSSPMNTPSAAPTMSFSQMQAQSPQRGGSPMTLPSPGTITTDSITAISASKQKAGTLGSYQQGAISAMKASGRSPEFMAKNLNQATAMRTPDWNLPADQASKAGAMANSGRTQSFIRGKLGLAPSVPVPGKASN